MIAVNGRQFDPATLREAVQQTATSSTPLELLIKSGEYYKTYRVDYRGGERYPHLERDDATPDLISLISSCTREEMTDLLRLPLIHHLPADNRVSTFTDRISLSGTVKMSPDNTVTSASFPTFSDPLLPSSNAAYALLIV